MQLTWSTQALTAMGTSADRQRPTNPVISSTPKGIPMNVNRRTVLLSSLGGATAGIISAVVGNSLIDSLTTSPRKTRWHYHVDESTSTDDINAWLRDRTDTGTKTLSGVHTTSTQLVVPSDTRLDLSGCTLIRGHSAGGNGGATIVNSDQEKGNHNITIIGGILLVAPHHVGKHFGFVNVSELRISDNTIKGAAGDFMAVLKNCNNVSITRLQWSGSSRHGEDGLHLYGGSNYNISDCHIRSGDDALALTVEAPDNTVLENVNVTNCSLSSTMASAIKIHAKSKARDAAVRSIHITNVSIVQPALNTGHDAIRMLDESSDDNKVHSITLSSISIDNSGGPGTGVRASGIDQLRLDNISIRNIQGQSVWVSGKSRDHKDLILENILMTDQKSGSGPGITVSEAERFTISTCVIDNPAAHGILVRNSNYGIIRGNTISGSPQSAIRIEHSSDLTLTANVLPMNESTVTEVADSSGNSYDSGVAGSSARRPARIEPAEGG